MLEQTENKVLRAAFELEQVKKEIARRVEEKETEFSNTRKNYGKALEGMQVALETETKAKVELARVKKKLEADVLDLTGNLEHANAANTESQKNIKRIGVSIREMQSKYEDESHAKAAEQDRLLAGERKANSLNNQLEELKTLLEQSDRNRRLLEQELADSNEGLSELTCQNQSINGARQKCENEVRTIGADLDEMTSEVQISGDKSQHAMIDTARLADEPKAAMMLEKDKKQRLSATLNTKLIEDEPSHQTWLLPEVICTSGLPVRSQDADILSRKIRGHLWRSAYTPPDIVTPSKIVFIKREGDKFSEIVEELLLENEVGLSLWYLL